MASTVDESVSTPIVSRTSSPICNRYSDFGVSRTPSPTPDDDNVDNNVTLTINDEILTELKKNRALLEKVIQKQMIQDQEIQIIKMMINNNPRTEPVEVFEIKQCKSFDELKDLDENLKKPETMNTMILKLSTVGGKDKSDTIKRVLTKLISHELALNLTWFDRKHSTKLCFGDLGNVTSLVFESTRKNVFCPLTTMKDVEVITRAWFKNAPDRMGGRAKRNT